MDNAEKSRLKKELMQRLGLGTKEEAVAKGITDLSDKDKAKMMSNLMQGEDSNLATLSVIADRYGLTWLRQTVDEQLELRMSVGGWKAEQIVKIASELREQQRQRSVLARIFHRNEDNKKGYQELE